MNVLPKQKVSKAERTDQWFRNNIEYRINQSNFWSSDRWELILLYKAASGELQPEHYKHVLNPFDSPEGNTLKFPAQMRNMDIISPIIASFLGEKANMTFNAQVVVANPDKPNKSKDELNQRFSAALAQHLINNLNQSGIITNVESKEVPSFQQILDDYNNSDADDKRAIFGQEALDYLKYDLNLKDKYQEAFYDWLVTGRTYTFKTVYKDDVIHEIVPPLELWHGTTRTGFIEDSDWAVRRSRYNMANVIDRFHKVFKPEEITNLEEKFRNGNSSAVNTTFTTGTPNIDKAANINSSNYALTSDLIDVFHVVWKGYVKVGILTYINELGQQDEMEVDETYQLNKENGDISIEWDYNTCVFEGYKIGQDFYKYCQEFPVQRNGLSNSSVTKLPYNGRVGYNERGTINSVVKQLLPYQALYNIYDFRRELILARNKDKIMMLPLGIIPDEFGVTLEGLSKYLHYVETTGIAFIDETKENIVPILNAIRGIDLSLGTYISEMTNIIRSIKDEGWDAIGMNRQRYGDVNSSDGKGVNDQAIFRSATITKEIFRRFQKFEESDLQGLIEYSKVAWINGKKGMYINSDGRKAFLEVNPENHLDADYGVFCVDSQEEAEKLKIAKDFSFGWAQKSTVGPSTTLEVIDANNMSNLKAKVAKAEKIEKQYQQSLQEQNNQSAQAIQDKKDQSAQLDREKDITVAQIKAHADLTGAIIGAVGNNTTNSENPSEAGNKYYNDVIQNLIDNENKKLQDGANAIKRFNDVRLKEADLRLKEKDMENKLKIAKANKNRYDK